MFNVSLQLPQRRALVEAQMKLYQSTAAWGTDPAVDVEATRAALLECAETMVLSQSPLRFALFLDSTLVTEFRELRDRCLALRSVVDVNKVRSDERTPLMQSVFSFYDDLSSKMRMASKKEQANYVRHVRTTDRYFYYHSLFILNTQPIHSHSFILNTQPHTYSTYRHYF